MNSINQLGSTARQAQVNDQSTINYSGETTQSQAYSALDTPHQHNNTGFLIFDSTERCRHTRR